MDVLFHERTKDPLFAIALHGDSGRTAFATSTQLTHGPTGEFGTGEQASVRIQFDNWLAPAATASRLRSAATASAPMPTTCATTSAGSSSTAASRAAARLTCRAHSRSTGAEEPPQLVSRRRRRRRYEARYPSFMARNIGLPIWG